MRIDEYPPQEPLSAVGQAYGEECLRRGQGVAADEEVRYGADPYQSLAVHRAAKPNGTILLFWHGGGWTSGYKEHMSFMAPVLNAGGVTFVTAGYRLAPQHLFPVGLNDCADAAAWVHANAARLGADPSRLLLGGHSAGGHYAALLAVTRGWRGKRGLPEDVVRGCVPISGVYKFGAGTEFTVRPRFLGPENADTDRAASPILSIEGTPPPFFITYGERDFPHLTRQADAMEAALRAAGSHVEKHVFPGRDHFGASHAGGEADGPFVPKVLAWMKGLR